MDKLQKIKLIECPRDAIQGINTLIDTQKKIDYINFLLDLNIFDTIDFGSFVSPKAMPQMADSLVVANGLTIGNSTTKLLAIVANERGANEAANIEKINFLGFPFSISETFQQRNTNASIAESVIRVQNIQEICVKNKKKLVLYISMAFGNPYGDIWNADIVEEWILKLKLFDIQIFSLSDTIGIATPESIKYLCGNIFNTNKSTEIGIHLHTKSNDWQDKIEAAVEMGCNRFDGAILGYGGCPMAQDELVGNMPMEKLLEYFERADINQIEMLKTKFKTLIN
jgi:hydroxymethylglutaryl-CoA lyase